MSYLCCICGFSIKETPFFINENEKKGHVVCSPKCMEEYIETKKKKEDGSFLFREICRIYHLSEPTPRMFAEMKRLRENEGLSDNNIVSVLHYIYDVKCCENPSYPSMYMVPQYVEEAKQYYMKLKQKELSKKQTAAPVAMRELKPNYAGATTKKKVTTLNPDDV